ncbi:hypothetical protein EV702DRAFT_1051928 [Suillus placidus]|uniref:Uncharacterized protein n=1 Tax=Suillus placidus TaxID=48579 RepID=A0A9P6ZF86_9AGAM|nr:hypothetical protein EV702DRAFT_1051928 [Suillus placidus]
MWMSWMDSRWKKDRVDDAKEFILKLMQSKRVENSNSMHSHERCHAHSAHVAMDFLGRMHIGQTIDQEFAAYAMATLSPRGTDILAFWNRNPYEKRNRLSPVLMEALQMVKFFLKKEWLNFMKGWAASQSDMEHGVVHDRGSNEQLTATASANDALLRAIAEEECDNIEDTAIIYDNRTVKGWHLTISPQQVWDAVQRHNAGSQDALDLMRIGRVVRREKSKFKDHGRITPEGFVAAGDFLSYKFPVCTCTAHQTPSPYSREKGDASKAHDYLPTEKQYLVTHDAERLLSFTDSSGAANEWVETHAGRNATVGSAASPSEINYIPDLDGDGLASAMADVSIVVESGAMVGETPDLDDIPDMEEEGLEEGEDEATTAPFVPKVGGDSPIWRNQHAHSANDAHKQGSIPACPALSPTSATTSTSKAPEILPPLEPCPFQLLFASTCGFVPPYRPHASPDLPAFVLDRGYIANIYFSF